MEQDRYQKFCDRIMAEEDVITTHFGENPLLSHFLRVADVLNTLFLFRFCPTNSQHWACIVPTSNITRRIYTLAVVKPDVLDSILAEFKEDFKEMVPPGFMNYAAAEFRGYPIPNEMKLPPESV